MVNYPILSDADGGRWIDPSNVIEFARACEQAGVDALSVTDHPAPSAKWLRSGGHETFDPFVALSFVAAATTNLQVMTHLTVIPYRNPFLTARSMVSVDRLSGGRSIFVVGTGYLRSEFAALGVDFDERNDLFDEAAEVIRAAWSGEELRTEGRHFAAHGVVLRPLPVQPEAPLWLGGNSRAARQRAAAWGQGWAPMLGPPMLSQTARTRHIEDEADLARLIAEVKEEAKNVGRDAESLEFLSGSATPLPDDASADQRVAAIARLAEIGVTWTSAPIESNDFSEALERLDRFGRDVISEVPGRSARSA
jgi:probable F420-dependent oxidoreductase